VSAEVALACALLVSSALLVRTVSGMMDTATGVTADDVVTTTVQLTRGNPSVPLRERWQNVADVHSRILETIREQPGVLHAGAANFLPLETGWRSEFGIDGVPPPARLEDAPQAQLHSISEGYLEAMGANLADGRAFSSRDHSGAPGVVLVNETFARRYLSGGRAPGRVLRIYATGIGPLGVNLKAGQPREHAGLPFEVIGVVRDVRNVPLGQEVEPAIYFAVRQFPFAELFLAVRATEAGTAQAAIRSALQQVTPNVPAGTMRTWGERFGERTAEARLLMTILVFFGGLAALLAALGVYGLLSWSVALRRRELAIRLVLGDLPRRVGTLVVRQSVALVLVGVAAGWLIVRAAEGALARVLYQVSPSDLRSTLAASALLLAAALLACVPPALRASRVDPVEGLRVE
jgi:putative ABC transport system permease protein